MIEAFGISAVILTVHWAINIKVGRLGRDISAPVIHIPYAQGGVAYVENMGIPFNWHPILMTISLIFLYGNGEILLRPFAVFICTFSIILTLATPTQELSSTE